MNIYKSADKNDVIIYTLEKKPEAYIIIPKRRARLVLLYLNEERCWMIYDFSIFEQQQHI